MQRDQIRRGRLSGERSSGILHYLSSMDADHMIADADVLVDIAHLLMLHRQKLIGDDAARALMHVLLDLHENGLPEEVFDDRFEDIHAGIEAYLLARAGEEYGGRLHLGRSRNDEVAACIRIRARDEVIGEMKALIGLREVLADLARNHIETIMPGFTHLQAAQPITLAHHLLAYEQAFARDFARLHDAYARLNASPLGAAAFASTGFAIDREYTQALLGFDSVLVNSMDAVSTRDFALEILADNAIIMANASRLCEELVIWSSSLVRFIELADAYCSCSSIMPQKKNPDTAEIMRAKAGSVFGSLMAGLSIVKSLPMSYNRDLQELTPHLWQGIRNTRASLPLLSEMLGTASFDTSRLHEESGKGFSTATELADVLVREFDLPFRTAHTIVGRAVRTGSLDLETLDEAARDAAGISLKERGLTKKRITDALDVRSVVSGKVTLGGPAPTAVEAALQERDALLEKDRRSVLEAEEAVSAAYTTMIDEARRLIA